MDKLAKGSLFKTTSALSVHPSLYLLLTIIIWASTFINLKILLPHIPANTLAFARFLIASLVFVPWFITMGKPRIRKRDYPRVIVCGSTGVTLYNFLQNQGLTTAGAIDGSILDSMAPVFIALLAVTVLREKISGIQVLGIVLALLGSAVVVTNGSMDLGHMDAGRMAGDILILLTGVCWAIYSTVLKGLLLRYDPSVLLVYTTWIGTLLLLPLAMLEPSPDWAALSLSGWLHLFYLGLFASGLAYLLWNKALSQVPAATAGAFLYLIPLFASLMAAVFLHERLGVFTVLGGLAVLFGTYLANLSPAQEVTNSMQASDPAGKQPRANDM